MRGSTMQHAVRQRGGSARPSGHWVGDHWREVTPAAPCAACGATEGCGVMRAELFARCEACPSEWPLTAGGWLHRSPARSADEAPPLIDGARPGPDARR